MVVALLIVVNFTRSAAGRACISIREDEIASEAMGINTTKYKVIAFVIGALIASWAGALYAGNFYVINPGMFTYSKSIDILVIVVFGGMGSMTGSVISAVVLGFINSFFKESGNTFPQGDELSFTIFYQAGFAVPKKVQLAVEFRGMTLPATTYTYELEKDKEVNGTYSYFTLQFSDANFKLNPGDYEIFLRYRFNDNEEWIDAGWNHSAYNYHMALRATETDITWLGYNEYIEGTPIVLRATEDYRIFEATTTIRNNSTFEYHPLMSFLIVPEGEEPQHGILLENQGRLYLEAGEEQEFKVMFEQTLEPGNYSIYAVYRDNIYYAWLEETKIDFTIPEKTTANETISANDFSIRVYTDRIAVQSASTIRQIELYDISGRLAGSIRAANELPVDGLADGVYIVRVTTDEGVQTEKVILHR